MVQFQFGPVSEDDGVLFRIWAPLHDRIGLKLNDAKMHAMRPVGDGWHYRYITGVGDGTLYHFVLSDGTEVPDPASRFQPRDVHGPSEVIDPAPPLDAFDGWKGRPWEEMVIYEMHMGCFTSEGTYHAAIGRLDHLRQLGVTAIQIMPLADFPGSYGWGYDGVLPYAPDSSYGRPEDLRAFIAAAHNRGICVFLDVVYNHLGPIGNYMPLYAPLFTERHRSPWGQGINYDGENSRLIRDFFIENAIYWVTEFGFDGLRLDAVHAICDDSAEHLLHELSRRVRQAAGERHVHLIVENEDNDADLLYRHGVGKPSLFTAQWNDDIHHVLHIAATGEKFGYYADYAGDTAKIGRALVEGFVFQGEHMPYRGDVRGKPSRHLPSTAFISFIQNHDQIGNRAEGDRMANYACAEAIEAIAAIYLLAPQIPMLFMGEEWGAKEPFPYFCDFDEEHNEKVRKGRREELSRLPGFDAEDLIDPAARSTFQSGKLYWEQLHDPSCKKNLEFYRKLLAIRRSEIVPLLNDGEATPGRFSAQDHVVTAEWQLAQGKTLRLSANLSNEERSSAPLENENRGEPRRALFSLGHHENGKLSPWAVWWGVSPT